MESSWLAVRSRTVIIHQCILSITLLAAQDPSVLMPQACSSLHHLAIFIWPHQLAVIILPTLFSAFLLSFILKAVGFELLKTAWWEMRRRKYKRSLKPHEYHFFKKMMTRYYAFCRAVDVAAEVWGGVGAPLACWHLFYAFKLALGGLALKNTFHRFCLGCHVPHANSWIKPRLPGASWISRNIHQHTLHSYRSLSLSRSLSYKRLGFTFRNKYEKDQGMWTRWSQSMAVTWTERSHSKSVMCRFCYSAFSARPYEVSRSKQTAMPCLIGWSTVGVPEATWWIYKP